MKQCAIGAPDIEDSFARCVGGDASGKVIESALAWRWFVLPMIARSLAVAFDEGIHRDWWVFVLQSAHRASAHGVVRLAQIDRDTGHGCWVVVDDRANRVGGVFADRTGVRHNSSGVMKSAIGGKV